MSLGDIAFVVMCGYLALLWGALMIVLSRGTWRD